MDNFKSSLILQKMVFDKIKFERKGFKNNSELEFSLKVQMGTRENEIYKVTLVLSGTKDKEYDILISLTGFFAIENKDDLGDEMVNNLISKNAVAILMPYLRSELTLLTAQPDTDSVVLPPFNINKMMTKKSKTK